ncbi:shikimate 5-dehydrogenase [Rhodococcus hoagii]|nr:shikimate 5-dehydrogenase [Prescottella equi]
MSRTITGDVSKDTRLCMSLSGRPSNIGTRFHNYLYDELGLDFVYKAFTTTDLPAAIAGIRALGIRGCGGRCRSRRRASSTSTWCTRRASAIDSVNTIVNEDGELHAYNTDYQAVADLLHRAELRPELTVAVAGSGGMAKAVVAALRDTGFRTVTVVARNAETGPALARTYGFEWLPELGGRPSAVARQRHPGRDGRRRRIRRTAVSGGRGPRRGGGLRRRRDARRDPDDPARDGGRQDRDHRRGSDRAAGGGAVHAVHRDAPDR